MMIPSFLLKRLYVKGSLRNVENGFSFEIKNDLGSGYAKELLPLNVDGREVPKECSFFEVEGRRFPFTSVSPESPFSLVKGKTSRIYVEGMRLPKGVHRINMGFVVGGIGKLSFDIVDEVKEE